MNTRKQLQDLLWEYVEDTHNYIETVRDFCDRQQQWTLRREEELKRMRNIKDKADKEPEKKLGAVLKNTLQGLKELDVFMDAVENLAFTSQFVFSGQSFLPEDESPESVRSVITAARMASPLLINFKRNAKTFFLPSLSNLDVLCFQLDKYIQITKQICERMEKNSKSDLWYKDIHRRKKAQLIVKFRLNFSEDSMLKMLDHLKQLCEIRMDQHTKLTLVFQEYALRFIGLFSQRYSRMEKHLSDLEESAVQLDRMKMGASISTVAGSSVGIVGGALSIAGLCLAPVTAGASLGLTIAGLGAGVTSGANSLITGITEAGVNHWHETKSQNIFKQYMDDVEKILNCLDQASSQEHVEGLAGFSFITAGKLAFTAIALGKGIKGIKDAASAVKVLKTEKVIAAATKAGLQEAQSARNIPKLAAELPDIGQLAKGTPLALSKSARAGFIGLNALFIGLDVFFICKESISLANGSESEASQLIRSRAALWRSELEDWKKIHDSLRIGGTRVKLSQEVLEKPFLPLQHRTLLLVLLLLVSIFLACLAALASGPYPH
ncbi:hypothetical protein R3I93_002378 [Phoxinus phoxinus]|uniref:Apolipoprotein L4 n=1 Tax=Phoxinus phoxinus TaxID=58324 RepID=A0AAN9HJY0_9TELE